MKKKEKEMSEEEKYHKEESDWALTTADEHNEKWLNEKEGKSYMPLLWICI